MAAAITGSIASAQSTFATVIAPVWIWTPHNADVVLFRKTVRVDAPIARATFSLTADGFFTLYINDARVGQNVSWDDARTIDVSRFLREGKNVIAVRVDRKRVNNGFIFNGSIELQTRARIEIKSDESWVTSSAVTPQWTRIDLDDSLWDHAVFHAQIDDFAWPGTAERIGYQPPRPPAPQPIGTSGTDALVTGLLGDRYRRFIKENRNPISIVPVAYLICNKVEESAAEFAGCNRHPYLNGLSVNSSFRGKFIVFDFGRDAFGHASLRFEAANEAAALVTVTSGEDLAQLLDPQFYEPHAHSLTRAPQQEDVYRAARYLAIALGDDVPAGRLYVFMNFQAYPVVNKGFFASSDPALNAIWLTAVETVRVNMQGYYWDGIRRDRALWVGDLLEEARTNYYSFGDLALVKKSLFNLSLYRGSEHQVRAQLGIGNANWYLTDYVAKYVSAVAEYYLFSGDLGLVRDLRPVLSDQLAYLGAHEDQNGLIIIKNDPAFPDTDWSSSNRYGESTYQQLVYYKALRDGAFLMGALGDAGRSCRCSGKFV